MAMRTFSQRAEQDELDEWMRRHDLIQDLELQPAINLELPHSGVLKHKFGLVARERVFVIVGPFTQ